MKPEHTPGPWEVNGNAIEGGNMHLASVIDERDIPIDATEVDANARLMAAAPDLLEALQLAAPHTSGKVYRLCLAAIAKATGLPR
jgi:hypothetical protein